MLPAGALRNSIEEKYGTLPSFVIYALLEWLVIFLLFVDGFLAHLSNEIARFFDLKTPCLLCTRLDHLLVQKSSTFYCNDSICDLHKEDISNLSYCHVHHRLSDIRTMCQPCLLSKDDSLSDSDHVKQNKTLLEDDPSQRKLHLKQLKKKDGMEIVLRWCSCCGVPTKSKPFGTASFIIRDDDVGPMDFHSSSYRELKLIADTGDAHGMIEEEPKTPIFSSRNKYFGLPLTSAASPMTTKSLDLTAEPIVEEGGGEGEGEDIVARLKRQVTHDRRSLMALYMELDEERSAAAVAANNAMAMITRLQAEKAAVQMEASQYQRMMEEQAEYDQEAMKTMQDVLFKREEEMKALEDELEEYKVRFGIIKDIGSEVCEVDLDEDYQGMVHSSSHGFSENETDQKEIMECQEQFALDYERERGKLLGLMRELLEGHVEGDEAVVAGDVSLIRERLRGVEAESGFLKHAAMTLQRGSEGMKLLSEIAQNLRRLRQSSSLRSPSEEDDISDV